jgi:MFS family permease
VSDGAWDPQRRLLTAGLIALVTAAAFEGMAVPTVLPELADELDGLELYGWAFSAFWLTNIIGITLAGLDTDRRGPARPFLIGASLFAAGMVISGLAGDMIVVIIGRAVQGFGSGAIGAIVWAVIARAYPASAKPRMIALTSSAWVVPGLIGPALAGAVTDTIGWRWVFLGVAPPVLLTAIALWRPLAAMGPARTSAPARSDARRVIDSVGLAVGSSLLLAATTAGNALLAIGMVVVGGWLAIAALGHLVPAGTLSLRPGRPSVVAVIFIIGFAFFGMEAFVPLTVVEVRGGTVTLGGLALSAAAVTWASGSWLQARAAAKGTRRALVTGGAALIAAGIVVTSGILLSGVPLFVAAIGWAIAGLGMGLAYSMLSLLILETATPGEEGFSSSALSLMFTLGTALGAGFGGAFVALADSGVLDLVTAIAGVNAVMFIAALAAVAIGLRVPRTGAAAPANRERSHAAGLPLEHP